MSATYKGSNYFLKQFINILSIFKLIQSRFINFPPNFGPIKLFLWTPEMGVDNPLQFQLMVQKINFVNHKFDRNRPTKVICHGWLTNANNFVKPFAKGENYFELFL